MKRPRFLLLLVALFLIGACDHDHHDHDHDHDHHDDHAHHDHDHHDDHAHHDHDHHDDHSDEIHFPREYQGRVNFRADEVSPRVIQPSLPVYANVGPASDADAYVNAPFDGRIQAPREGIPDVGDRVLAGQIVAYVLPRQDPAQTANLRAEFESAQVELARAERDLARITELVESGALPQRRLADAESDRDIAATRLERGRQALGQVAIHAPLGGIIAERAVTDGAYISAGDPLLRVVDTSRLRLEAMVPESRLSGVEGVEASAGAWFTLPGTDQAHHVVPGENARLLSAGDLIDPRTRSATIIFELQEPPQALRPGAFLTANLYTGPPREVLAIPRSAVIEEEGLDVVFLVHGRESFTRRVVTLGAADAEYVEVLQGLHLGDYVVSRGAYYVRLAAASTDEVGHGHSH